jgi:predicted PurR-regulated permease PerM
MNKQQIDISIGIIVKTILVILGIWFLYLIRGVLALLFISIIITAAIDPVVNRLQKRKVPRSLGILIIYLILFLVIGLIISLLIPPLVSQFKDFAENFPSYAEKITSIFQGLQSYFQLHGIEFNIQEVVKNAVSGFITSSGQIFSKTIGVFSGLLSVIVVLSMTFYMSAKEDGLKQFILSITPRSHHSYAVSAIDRVKIKIGKWLQGQLMLMVLIFILDFLVLYFLGVPYALLLALIGGVLEIVPYLGPIISGALATVVGFLVSPLTGILVLASYLVIQQIENHIIVPQVMKKAVGLNPVAVILALLIGAQLGGALGAILAIPIAAVAGVFASDIISWGKQNSKDTQEQLSL